MRWVVLTYRLPAEPTRHRVAVWRELRRVGALGLQQATWAVPARDNFLAAVDRAVELEAEWAEFLSECTKFDDEIDKEIAIEKFTVAELDEEEQNLDRLRRWHRDLRGRDVFIAPSHEQADRRLKECGERLEEFAERVYQHRKEH